MRNACSVFRLGHCRSGGDHLRPDIAGASLKVRRSEVRSHQHNGTGREMGFIMHIQYEKYADTSFYLSAENKY